MSALYPLQDPLSRGVYLPTTMAFRGTWNATTQYYPNEVAVSPIDGNAYLTTVPIRGGSDPSTGVATWTNISSGGALSGQFSIAPATWVSNGVGTQREANVIVPGVTSSSVVVASITFLQGTDLSTPITLVSAQPIAGAIQFTVNDAPTSVAPNQMIISWYVAKR